MTKKEIDKILFGFGVDTYNRFQTFLSMVIELEGEYYWHALRNAYDASDNLFDLRSLVKAAFQENEPNRDTLMNKDERDYLQSLPEQNII